MNEVETRSLQTWTPTNDFSQLVEKLMRPIDSGTLFNDSDKKHQELMEAHCTAKFAQTLGYTECKLIDAVFPDAACRNTPETTFIEITELQDKGRRRGAEYKNESTPSSPKVQSEKQRNTVKSEWDKWLAEAITKKLNKSYDTSKQKVDLVVYMNVGLHEYTSESDCFWRRMEKMSKNFSTKSLLCPFEHIWVLYKNHALMVWPRYQKHTDHSADLDI